jgi:ferric-chelate reductase (NADPH)
MTDPTDEARMARPGLVTRTLRQWLMREARVVAVQTLSPHFRSIDLEGEALKGVDWSVGQKIQVAMGAGLTARTYTPLRWDAEHGRTRLLAYAHGNGPASLWAMRLREGDVCQFLGPRRSLEISGVEPATLLFGDETSFALASALRESFGGSVTCVVEVSDVAESRSVLTMVGLGDATLIERSADEAHLAKVAAEIAASAIGTERFILSGKASSIQYVSRVLKASGVEPSRIQAKAYWAPGKAGLD